MHPRRASKAGKGGEKRVRARTGRAAKENVAKENVAESLRREKPERRRTDRQRRCLNAEGLTPNCFWNAAVKWLAFA